MDTLENLGLRIDSKENLRIISDKTVHGSVEISSKIKSLLDNLEEAKERLGHITHSLKTLESQTQDLQLKSLAVTISKLIK